MQCHVMHEDRCAVLCGETKLEARRHKPSYRISGWSGCRCSGEHLRLLLAQLPPGASSPLLRPSFYHRRQLSSKLILQASVVSCTLVRRRVSLSQRRHCLYINKLARFRRGTLLRDHLLHVSCPIAIDDSSPRHHIADTHTDDRLVLLQPCPTESATCGLCSRAPTPLPLLSPAAAPR